MEAMDRLRDYVLQRRSELRLSQRDLAKRAGMSNNTLAAIEVGRVTKAPTLDTLEALAKGLSVDPQVLIDIARGKDTNAPQPGDRPALTLIDSLGELTYPPDEEERRIIQEADDLGLVFPLFTEPGFWTLPPVQRRRLLRDVESSIDEARDVYKLMGREVPKHGG